MTALRSLLRAPVFTIVAVGALSLGIGANSALFSVIDGVLLKPLPYPNAERLVSVAARGATGDRLAVSYQEFRDWRAQKPSSIPLMAFAYGVGLRLRGREGATNSTVAYTSGDFFPAMGAIPLLGRLPSADEMHSGSAHVLVLGYDLWRKRFAGDPRAIGQTLDTDRGAFTVIGVMPPSYRYPEWAQAWTPLEPMLAQTPALANRDWRADNRFVARLAPEASLERAQSQLALVTRRLATEYKEDVGLSPEFTPLTDEATSTIRPSLVLLAAAVAMLLLIACANVANLSLVRGSIRAREFAVRAALGADARRIARQLLAESAWLAAASGAIGLGLAWITVRLLRAAAPAELPRVTDIALDWRAVAFTLLICALTPLLFGLVPVLQATRLDLAATMKHGSRGAGHGRREGRTRSAFIVVQVALSLVLLVGAGLLGRSFLALRATSPGYDPERLIAHRIDGLEEKNNTPEKLLNLYARVREAVVALPGTESVGFIYSLPPTGVGVATRLQPAGRQFDAGKEPVALYQLADAGYFATVRQPIIRGRAFMESDMTPSSRAIIVTAIVASRLWPGQDAVGQRLRVFKQAPGRPDTNQPVDGEVIGVAGNVKFGSLTDTATAEIYLPIAVNPWRNTFIVARQRGDEASYIAAMRRAISAVDPDISVDGITSVPQMLSSSLAGRRFYLVLLSAFAAVALTLASVGIYGVIAYGVTQRRHEIGVRTALGAQRPALLALFVREGIALALVGAAIGLPLAALATRLLASMLYGVGLFDAVTFGGVAVVLIAVAGVASYLPARRLTRVDPVEALRGE
ncbi:MAG: ABC transporter permease [Gemmatimonadota bacterium]|nr:ABC transporter permease [Gemmatimonadota bacterium]